MRKGSITTAIQQALDAWPTREEQPESMSDAIARHALAHSVSPSGLYRAMVRTGMLQPKPRGPRQASA